MKIIIQTHRHSRREWRLYGHALRQMGEDYRAFNKQHFRDALTPAVHDLDDGPARFLTWTVYGSLFVPLAVADKQPWRMVQETTLQMMVHQYVYQHLKLADGPEHTQAFLAYCARPRVRLALAMTYGLPSFAGIAASPAEERLQQRVARLLALSESPNPHEAAAALQEAQRLMLKYNIDLSLQTDHAKQPFGLRHLGRPLPTVNEANRKLGHILHAFFFVRCIWVPTFDPHNGRDGTVLEVCGSHANLAMAEHVYAFLVSAAERLWRCHQQARGRENNKGQQAFVLGVYEGFGRKLRLQQRRNQVEGLVWLGDKGLDEFYNEQHPHTKPLEPTRAMPVTEERLAGIKAGIRLDLFRPIESPAEGAAPSPAPSLAAPV